MVEKFGDGMVAIKISKEELEDSIAGLTQLKPILQRIVIAQNGKNVKQGMAESAELGKHFDTAIETMTSVLAGIEGFLEEIKVEEDDGQQNNSRFN